MIGVDIKFEQFLDRPAVQDALTRANKRVLGKAGAFVRTSARRSIRKRKAVSQPGSPPSSHNGLLRDGIVFGYDAARETVVVGPRKLRTRGGDGTPTALEFGGTLQRKGELRTYRPRPFMRPALEGEADKFPGLFRNAVK